MTETSILAILGIFFGGGTVAALISYWANRRRNAAETDNLILEGAKSLLKPLTDQVERLDQDLCDERNARKKVERELEQVQKDAAKRSENYDARIKYLENALIGKDVEIAKMQTEAETLKQQVARQRQQIEDLEAQLEELKQTPVTKLEGGTVIIKRKGTGPLKGGSQPKSD